LGIVLDVHLARSFDGVIRGAVQQPKLEEVIGLLGEPEAGVLDGTFGSVAFSEFRHAGGAWRA
jgi:hypothetical protein